MLVLYFTTVGPYMAFVNIHTIWTACVSLLIQNIDSEGITLLRTTCASLPKLENTQIKNRICFAYYTIISINQKFSSQKFAFKCKIANSVTYNMFKNLKVKRD